MFLRIFNFSLHLLFLPRMSTIRQVFIFLTIAWFGPDTNAKITTVRTAPRSFKPNNKLCSISFAYCVDARWKRCSEFLNKASTLSFKHSMAVLDEPILRKNGNSTYFDRLVWSYHRCHPVGLRWRCWGLGCRCGGNLHKSLLWFGFKSIG